MSSTQNQAEQQAKQEIQDADGKYIEMKPTAPGDRQSNSPDAEASRLGEAIRTGIADRSTQAGAVVDTASDHMASGGSTTGGDIDAMSEQAKVVGEEAVGGTTPTPGQNDIDAMAESVGVEMKPEEPIEVTEEILARDRQRWELNPQSRDLPSVTKPFEK